MRTQGAFSGAGLLLGIAVAAVARPLAAHGAQIHLAAVLSAGLAGIAAHRIASHRIAGTCAGAPDSPSAAAGH
ncbi:hypothetical protein KGA66_18370 [Actinocrinis puniceicyclus]|uniref:Uncharacterized protein n=1 Tax=Actinocrinis puniceicyclus TaxID=977794 RepID=A0A8J7WPD7_9ACTN|nr:hypothetical protein [Actinocrinis puniceicyclus]MBS2965028.1 hypothetical protein [Actinocrinis puniceicyclus]